MTTTSRIQTTLNDYRARLAHHEASAEAALNTAYFGVLVGIKAKLAVLYGQINDAMQNGTQLSPSWLHEQGRLKNITSLISNEINRFGGFALLTAKEQQQFGVTLGSQSAQEMLKATVPAGIHWTWGRPSTEALKAFIGVAQNGSPLAELFGGFGTEAASKVETELLLGLSLGQNPRVVAPRVEQALGISRNRALILSRNEMLRCYKGAATENYRANSDIVKQWRWTCAKSGKTCISCLMMDGTLHDISEDLESHVQCRCTPVPQTVGWDEILSGLNIDTSDLLDTRQHIQTGADWFDEQSDDVQRQVLGSAKYDAWKDEQFDLSDLVGHTHDEDWGHSIYEKSLKQLVGSK